MSARQQHIAPTKQQELLRLVRSLSNACRADNNVLKNAQLVDVLESQARAILQSRREMKKQQRRQHQSPVAPASTSTTSSASMKLNNAPTLSPQRNKLIQKLALAAAADDKSVSKRRKLSFEPAASPPASPFQTKATALTAKRDAIALSAAAGYTNASPLSVFAAGVVTNSNNNASPSLSTKAFKSLDYASLAAHSNNRSIDLSASMASTVASNSYDYVRSNASSPCDSMVRRCDTPQSNEQSHLSVDSIDWSPSDEEEHDEGEHEATGSLRVPQSTRAVMLALFELLQQDAKYAWLVDPQHQQRVAARVAASDSTRNQNSTQNTASALHEQFDALVCANAHLVAANAQRARDVELQQQRVQALVTQLETVTAANAAATNKADDADAAAVATSSSIQRVVIAADATITTTTHDENENDDNTQTTQQAMQRAAEASFVAQLHTQRSSIAALEHAAAAKDADNAVLMAHVAALTAASSESNANASAPTTSLMLQHLRDINAAREAEVQRLRSVVASKDRELCAMHMQLTTKQTLVEALAERLAAALTTFAGSKDVGDACVEAVAAGRVTLDVDSFVFADALAKQQTIDELTAALGVMEREVETLEVRVETLESDKYRLTLTHDDVTLTLESANAELLRVTAENELMEVSLTEKQTRIRALMMYVDEKEDQIMRLKDDAEHRLGFVGGGAGAATMSAY